MKLILERVEQFENDGVSSACVFGFSQIPFSESAAVESGLTFAEGEKPDVAIKAGFVFEGFTPTNAVATVQIVTNWLMDQVGDEEALQHINAVLNDLYLQRNNAASDGTH